MKRLLLFFAVLVGFSSVASAQFAYNDVKLYVAVADDIEQPKTWVFAAITRNGLTYVLFAEAGVIRDRIKKGTRTTEAFRNPEVALRDFYNCLGWNNFNKGVKYESIHSKYYVYKYNGGINYAFSSDLKSMIKWNDGKENNRQYYRLVDPSELEPKAANLDFLYE